MLQKIKFRIPNGSVKNSCYLTTMDAKKALSCELNDFPPHPEAAEVASYSTKKNFFGFISHNQCFEQNKFQVRRLRYLILM